jgi:hypothetical protein
MRQNLALDREELQDFDAVHACRASPGTECGLEPLSGVRERLVAGFPAPREIITRSSPSARWIGRTDC